MLVDHRTYRFRPGRVPAALELYEKNGLAPQTRHLGQPEFEVAGASQGFEAFLAPQLLAAPSQHGGDDDEKKRQACAGKEDLGEAEGLAGDLEDGLVKGHKRQSR